MVSPLSLGNSRMYRLSLCTTLFFVNYSFDLLYWKPFRSCYSKSLPLFYHLGQNCYCTKWNNCNWSKEAYNTAKVLPKENESFKEIQQAFQNYACGNSEEHTVFCCDPNERQPGILFFSTFLVCSISWTKMAGNLKFHNWYCHNPYFNVI